MLLTLRLPLDVQTSLASQNLGALAEGPESRVFVQFAVGSRDFGLTRVGAGAWRAHDEAAYPKVFVADRADVLEGNAPLHVAAVYGRPQPVSVIFAVDEDRTAIVTGDAGAEKTSGPIGDLCGDGLSWRIVDGRPSQLLSNGERYIKEMERLLAVSGPGQRARRFFFEIDRQTHPGLEGGAFAKLEARWLVKMSFEHRTKRAQRKGFANLPDSVRYTDGASQEFLRALFPIFEAGLALLGDDVDDAMDHFANGALRLQLRSGEWTTQPSSGFFFLFGEVGLLGVEFRDPRLWLPYARAAIRAQEIFARVYRDSSAHRDPYLRFDGCAFDAARRCTTQECAALRATYATMTLEQLQVQSTVNARRLLGIFP